MEMGPNATPPPSAVYKDIISPAALDFVAELTRLFRPRVHQLLQARKERQNEFDAGGHPDFFPETKKIREGQWVAAPLPADIQDRRVELTGPADDTKMVIGALNCGANVYMTDFEDSLAPTWENVLRGQLNLYHAVRRTLSFTDSAGKVYKLNSKLATLFVRPRGWHLEEENVLVDGEPIPACFFDFGIYVFLNATQVLANGTGLYFYLPKMEHYLEARLWGDIFRHTIARLSLPEGCIRATVLIETLPAAFQMHEIIWELREFSAGLNCGRWDYIFRY